MIEENVVADVRALEELAGSRGWMILVERCNRETDAVVNNIVNPRANKENAFERGAIWAARQLVAMPERLLDEYKMELLAKQAKEESVE